MGFFLSRFVINSQVKRNQELLISLVLETEAWRPEEAAMRNSTLPTVLDKLVMVGNINVRKLIGEVSDQIKIRRAKIENPSKKKVTRRKIRPSESRISTQLLLAFCYQL